MYKAIFYMVAYNAEKYIQKSIESVLKQTEKDFVFFILDNGSTDGTGEIIKEYKKMDNRIVMYRFEENHHPTDSELTESNALFMKFTDPENSSYAEYLAYIDSDDIYYPEFLEYSYKEIKARQADILIVGSEFIDEKSNKPIGYRLPPDGILLEDKSVIIDGFQNYQHHFRTLWGKLISMKFAPIPNGIDHYKDNIINGLDTYTVLHILLLNPVVAGSSKVLHQYLVRENSHFFSTFDLRRFHAADTLHNLWSQVSEFYELEKEERRSLLDGIYCSHIKDLFELSIRAKNRSIDEKINYMSEALNRTVYREIYRNSEYYIAIREMIVNSVKFILAPLSDRKRHYYMKYLLVRLAMTLELEQQKKVDMPLSFSVLCDEGNQLKWCSFAFNRYTDIDTRQATNLCNRESEVSNLKLNQALIAFDDKNYESLKQILLELEKDIPLNKFVLYIKMMLSLNDKSYDGGCIAAIYSNIFWKNDEDLKPVTDRLMAELSK